MKAKKVLLKFVDDIVGHLAGYPGSTHVQTYLYLPGDKIAATTLEDEVLTMDAFKIPKEAKVESIEISEETADALRRMNKDKKTVLSAIKKLRT